MTRNRGWLVVVWTVVSSLAGWATGPEAVKVSDEDEIKIGRVLAQKFEQAEGIAATPQGRKLDAYLQKGILRASKNDSCSHAAGGFYRILEPCPVQLDLFSANCDPGIRRCRS